MPGCCDNRSDRDGSTAGSADAQSVRDKVREGYAKIARAGKLSAAIDGLSAATDGLTAVTDGGCCGPASTTCCGSGWSAEQLAGQLGYSSEQLASLPREANMGLSCGNPTAIAALKPGQVVLDLGSGGGFDCFLAGPKVGASGRVIGVDMTAEMLSKARRSIATYRRNTGLDNVEFRLGEIEHLPVADASVDVVISNCVINLSPDKPQVWREIARVLRPGGHVAVSDLALLRPLPQAVRQMVDALIGCVAGAVLVEEYRAIVEASGLTHVTITPKPDYVAALSQFEDPLYRRIADALPAGTTASDFITSIDVTASK